MAKRQVDAGHVRPLPPYFAIKRVYDEVDAKDGFRVLVDRLWPRGISRDKAHVDLWLKELAPSDALRHWFAHEPAKWSAFVERYRAELQANEGAIGAFEAELAKHAHVTLLYAARDEEYNNALALLAYVLRRRVA